MKTRLQHLPADVHGLSAVARAGISSGASFGPVPVILRAPDIPRPAERLGEDERGALTDLVDRGLADAGIALAPAARDHRTSGPKGSPASSRASNPASSPPCPIALQGPAGLQARRRALRGGVPRWSPSSGTMRTTTSPSPPRVAAQPEPGPAEGGARGSASGRTPVGELTIRAGAQRLDAVRAQLRGVVEEHGGADAAPVSHAPRRGAARASLLQTLNELAGPHGLVVCEPERIRPTLQRAGPARLRTRWLRRTGRLPRAGEAELEGPRLRAAIPVDGPADGPGRAPGQPLCRT